MPKESNWKVSYAQNREDILLARALPSDVGFYLDIGAADPVEYSVTKLFYDRGWSGVNVEPQEDYYRKLVADRPRDTNLRFVLSDRPGVLTFYVAPTHPGWATVNESVARQMTDQGIKLVTQEVQAVSLADVCGLYAVRTIDFLKIDVEGAERNVLLGGDFSRWRPRVVVIEATEQGGSTPNHHLWEDVILGGGYLFATFDGLNRYYVRAEEPELVPILQVPVNVFDEFSPYEYQSRLWELEAEANTLRQNSARLDQELADARAGVDELHGRVNGLEQARTAVEVERNDAWVECENLRTEVSALSRDLATATAREREAHRRLDAARSRLRALTAALTRAASPAGALGEVDH